MNNLNVKSSFSKRFFLSIAPRLDRLSYASVTCLIITCLPLVFSNPISSFAQTVDEPVQEGMIFEGTKDLDDNSGIVNQTELSYVAHESSEVQATQTTTALPPLLDPIVWEYQLCMRRCDILSIGGIIGAINNGQRAGEVYLQITDHIGCIQGCHLQLFRSRFN